MRGNVKGGVGREGRGEEDEGEEEDMNELEEGKKP